MPRAPRSRATCPFGSTLYSTALTRPSASTTTVEADEAVEGAAVHGLLSPRAPGFGDLGVLVGQQRELQLLCVGEMRQLLNRIVRYAERRHIRRLEDTPV